jgi:hypothetical protein
MLTREQAELIRRMTPGERLKMTFEMIRAGTADLLRGPPDVVNRRFELLRRQNDLRNQRILEALARSERGYG